MDNVETIYRKGFRGQEAISTVSLYDQYELQIRTSKNSNGQLQTFAKVDKNTGDGFTTHRVYQDYTRSIARIDARCTAKNIKELHEDKALGHIELWIELATEHQKELDGNV